MPEVSAEFIEKMRAMGCPAELLIELEGEPTRAEAEAGVQVKIKLMRASDVSCATMVSGHLGRCGLNSSEPVHLFEDVRLVETITKHPPGAFYTFHFSDGTDSPKYNGADEIVVVEL